MFYFFSKTLSYVLTPAGILLILLLLALLTRRPRRKRWLVGLALGVFWLFGNAGLMNEWALCWEYAPAPRPTDSTNRVAVVLTGGIIDGMKATPDERFLLDREADRVGQALYLYRTGAVRKILISGGHGDLPFMATPVKDEGRMAAWFLMAAGVRPTDIVLERRSRNTHENALFTARMLRRQFNTNRCVLITSAWHMRRAVGCFRKAGVEPTPFPGSFMSHERTFLPGDWLLPNAESFFDAYYLSKEITGYVVYWVAGYV